MTTTQSPTKNYNSFILQVNRLKGLNAHRFMLQHIKQNMLANPRLVRKIKRERKRRMSTNPAANNYVQIS